MENVQFAVRMTLILSNKPWFGFLQKAAQNTTLTLDAAIWTIPNMSHVLKPSLVVSLHVKGATKQKNIQ
jgi:hypothetical protein